MKPLQLLQTNCWRFKSILRRHDTFVAFLSTSLNKKKKASGYEDVNQEKYANLVRTVTTSKSRRQTPERIFEEDSFLYGKVMKSKPEERTSEPKAPRKQSPLDNPNKATLAMENLDPSFPLKFSLPSRSQLANGNIPSVTRILQQTMPMEQAFYLERWKQRMIMELGEEGFIEYTAAIFSQGKSFHTQLEELLLAKEGFGKKQVELEDASGYLASVQHVLLDVGGVKSLESAVCHPDLRYLGLLDCVAEYRKKLCVIDWKTSEKPKPHLRNTFDNPLQVAAYIGGVNHDKNYNFQVDCGLIVVAYKDGSPAHAHFMDPNLCLYYWDKWLLRLEEYTEKKEDKQ
uniref:Mitochondrial genome maintenance exonuclease 1 n=1 Tax=Leptobrachium leishanense TaxID=445787 RepID=A0A8C5MDH7_9ANUR